MESIGASISGNDVGFWIGGVATAWLASEALDKAGLAMVLNEQGVLPEKVKQPEISAFAVVVLAIFASLTAMDAGRKFVEIVGQLVTREPAPVPTFSMNDVLSHGARNILASSYLSNGSWKPGKLAGDSLLALDEVGQRTMLSVVWAALTWLLAVDIWGGNEKVGAVTAGLAAFACFFFVRGFLLSFRLTPDGMIFCAGVWWPSFRA